MKDHQKLGQVDPAVDARVLFSEYISKRRPVIVQGLLDDASFKGKKWVDLDYLAKKAGDTSVMVEPIHPDSKQYGTDVERISMPFKEFLTSLKSENGPHHYLTTQYSEQDEDQQTVLPPPANALINDFPAVPRVMGNLFLQQVNLWLGKSKDGSSSGLHHDFHDNLYCLLQGRKRFVLYPPKEIKNLYPHGTLDTLHSNGLISYKDGPVRSDGLPVRVAVKARIKSIEEKLEAMPKGKGKSKEISKERKALMQAHDEALDELAEMALEGTGGFEEDGEVDDFDALMAGLDGGDNGLAGAGASGSGGDEIDNEEDDEEDEEGEEEDPALGGDEEKSEEPSHFSRIPTAFLHQHLDLPTTAVPPPDSSQADFPLLKKTTAPYVVELHAGEMLYLPASWWHEVTSSSSEDGDGVHIAFNYWFYPPTGANFDEPYEDTLVWDYFREKARDNMPKSAPEQTGEVSEGKKRSNEDSLSRSKKKAKR